jgi:hypothetical protein
VLGVEVDDPDRVQQRLRLKHDIRVSREDIVGAREVDAGVVSVGPSPVLLIDNSQVGISFRTIDAANWRGRECLLIRLVIRLAVEALPQNIEGAVGGPVVDDDDLELRMV